MKTEDLNYSFQMKNKDASTNSTHERVVTYDGPVDYEKNVVNKPRLNGKEIVGDIEEEDPTMEAISLEELNSIFNSVFD